VIIGPRRAILIGAIAAVALTIILIPLIFSTTAPNFGLVKISLTKVTVPVAQEDRLELRPVFKITNPTDQTITTSQLEYELFADGVSLGTNVISYENVPVNGRPAIFSQGSVDIAPDPRTPFVVEYNNNIADLYKKIKDSPEKVSWRATGTAQLESTLVQEPVMFDSKL
jgi:LEA14-like dessication related protein